MLARYANATGDTRDYALIHLSTSNVNPEARFAFRLHHPDGDLAMKLDLDGAETLRPAREFKTLTELGPAFTGNDRAALITPIWCDTDHIGLISNFVSGSTALASATNDPSDDNLAVLGEQGALFLNALHSAEDHEEIGYWPEWVLKRLHALASKPGKRAPEIGPEDCARLIEAFRKISSGPRGTACLKTIAHGDFHGGNLIIANKATGLDMTELRRKLGLYDAVDYLASLDLPRSGSAQTLTDLGIHAALDEAFTTTYVRALPRPVLRCAMLGKWLILMFKISKARYAASQFQRDKLKRLQLRVSHML